MPAFGSTVKPDTRHGGYLLFGRRVRRKKPGKAKWFKNQLNRQRRLIERRILVLGERT